MPTSQDTEGPGAFAASGGGALVVGAAGFCAGFFGPIALNPDANQGPLVGIFITGPGGAILGAVVGGLLGALRASWQLWIGALTTTATLLVAGTLFFALPEPRFIGNVLELHVESCASPLSMKQEAFDHWDERIAAASWAAVRPRWKEGFEAMVAADPGVVLGVAVTRASGVYENRKPWNRGTLEGGKAWWVRERYFARGTCAEWPVGTTGVFDAGGDPRPSVAWPPDVLPNLLNLQVLTPSGPDRAALLR